MIVDDDKSIRETLSAILQLHGYNTTSVATAKEALEKVTTQFFDLMLLDINLPDKEGTQLLSDFRRATPETIKIIITGYPSLKNATEALNRGADLYLTKPLDPDDLLRAIRSKLEERAEKVGIAGKRMIEWTQRQAHRAQLTGIQEFSEKKADEFARFGLTKTEAKVYIGLAAMGVASASEIATASKIRREEIYRTLPQLEKKGLAARRFGTPRRFAATKPDAALKILTRTKLDTMAKEVDALEKKKDDLVSQLERITLGADEEEPSIEALSQQDSVLVKLAHMVQKVESQLSVAISSDLLWRRFLGHMEAREDTIKSKVIVRIVIEKHCGTELARLSKISTSVNKWSELRQVERLPFSLLMIDGKEAIWGEPHHESENAQFLWTNHQTQVGVLKMAFENLWEKSQTHMSQSESRSLQFHTPVAEGSRSSSTNPDV